MNRREALSTLALLFGGTIFGANAFLTGCSASGKKTSLFDPDDISLLDNIGDTIIPVTSTSPGAMDAKIGEFMKTIVTDCYSPGEQKIFTDGITRFRADCKQKYGKAFTDLSTEQRYSFLSELDKQAHDSKGKDTPHYFLMMKQLTLWGYFTSEPGATKALRYVAVPGKYEGDIPYKKGDKAWAT